ncbi:MAG: 5-carboxymethyl-2-hydroxymuconate Delta-isomerase [Ilumatobacter sp.]
MPHVIIEFSAPTCSTQGGPVDIDALVDAVHDAALATGTASIEALRTRAVGRNHIAVGDRHPDNGFIAVTARLGAGRPVGERRAFAAALLDAVELEVGAAVEHLMLSAEVQEIDPDTRINRNHARTAIAQRSAGERTPHGS